MKVALTFENFCQLEEAKNKHAAADAHGKQVQRQLADEQDKHAAADDDAKKVQELETQLKDAQDKLVAADADGKKVQELEDALKIANDELNDIKQQHEVLDEEVTWNMNMEYEILLKSASCEYGI